MPVFSGVGGSSDSTSAGKWGAAGYDSEQLTISGLTTLTAAKIGPAGTTETLVVIQVDTANIRWRAGANATAAIGIQVAAGDSYAFDITEAALLAITMYPVSGTPVVNVQYFYR